jgi:transcription factor 1
MEPDKDFYHPFIQPLLDQPESTYKLIPKSGILWDNLETATSKSLLPYQEPLKQDDPRREQLNDTLLLIANLGYYPKKSFLGFPSITTLMVHQLLAASRAHSLFHKYGQVRMLIWMINSEKVAILPKTVTTRKRSSIEAEISCEYIHEVAGSQQEDIIWHREYSVDIESAIHIKEKMKQAGLVTPEDRKGDLERQAETGEAMLEDSSGVERRPFFEELEALEAGFARKELVSAYKIDGTPIYDEIREETGKMVDNKKHKLHIRTPEHRRLAFLRYRLKQANKLDSTAEGILKEYDEITDQHSAILRSRVPDQEKISELEERISDWKTKFDDISHKTTRRVIARRIEDRRAFRQNPPLLLWDQRDAEPLEVSEHDFLPKQEMCLLDFQPKSLWPILLENNLSNYDYFEFLMSSIFMFPTQTIAQALKSVAPGADEWIIPRCPSLMDTTNGGAVSANVLGVRSLNQQMLKEIINAWMEWPFKPTKGEMVVRSGVQSVHNDVDELD